MLPDNMFQRLDEAKARLNKEQPVIRTTSGFTMTHEQLETAIREGQIIIAGKPSEEMNIVKAAPEMYNALKMLDALFHFSSDPCTFGGTLKHVNPAWIAAHAAIAKEEGGTAEQIGLRAAGSDYLQGGERCRLKGNLLFGRCAIVGARLTTPIAPKIIILTILFGCVIAIVLIGMHAGGIR